MEYEFENFGKFIQRVNLSIIFFCTFSIVTAIQISQFNKNLIRAKSIKTSIITSQSSVIESIKKALEHGTSSPELIWSTRFKDDDMRNLFGHELELEWLVKWFDKFWQNEKKEEAALQLQQIYFELSNISGYIEEIKKITGNDVKTIDSSIDSLTSFLNKREIKSIKLPLLGTEINVSLLLSVIPITQVILLLVVSGYIVISSHIMINVKNVKDLLSNTVLYATSYTQRDILHHLFKLPRLIPSLLMLFTLYVYDVLSMYHWQFWLTMPAIGIHIGATFLLDRKIFSIIGASNNALQQISR